MASVAWLQSFPLLPELQARVARDPAEAARFVRALALRNPALAADLAAHAPQVSQLLCATEQGRRRPRPLTPPPPPPVSAPVSAQGAKRFRRVPRRRLPLPARAPPKPPQAKPKKPARPPTPPRCEIPSQSVGARPLRLCGRRATRRRCAELAVEYASASGQRRVRHVRLPDAGHGADAPRIVRRLQWQAPDLFGPGVLARSQLLEAVERVC